MYYVYIYRDPRPNKNKMVVYVGKGQNNRAFDHWRNPEKCVNRRLKNLLSLLKRNGLEPIIEILYRFEHEQDALNKEIELIALYGRDDLGKGTLFNNTDGGEGIINMGPESRAKIGAAFKEHWQTEAYRTKRIKSQKAQAATPEGKKRRGQATKGNWQNSEVRAKMTGGIQAAQTPKMVAKRAAANKAGWTEEKRTAFSEQMKAQCQDPEHLKRRSEAAAKAWAKRKANWTEEDHKKKSEIAKATWAKKKNLQISK